MHPVDATAPPTRPEVLPCLEHHPAPVQRAELLRTLFDLMVGQTEELAVLISAENGNSDHARRGPLARKGVLPMVSEEAVRNEGGFGSSPRNRRSSRTA